MATYCKIPKKVNKVLDVHQMANYCVWCKGFKTAVEIASELYKQDLKKGIPAVGKVKVKGIYYHYCRYGFFKDSDIYAS